MGRLPGVDPVEEGRRRGTSGLRGYCSL
jgi:hypothetical protein